MNRTDLLNDISTRTGWDMVVVGGGATGLGIALEASSRGYSTLLVEQHDFCKGTSSRSTKLIHGGVRYLEQGNLRLVRDALRERGLLLRNAPDLVYPLRLVLPVFSRWQRCYYGTGLRIYDLLAGDLGIGRSRSLSVAQTIERLPTLKLNSLRGGILYTDAAFDDSRMGIALARAAARRGAVLVNYLKLNGFLKSGESICGVRIREQFGGDQYEVKTRVVVNATGVFSDTVRKMDSPSDRRMLALSRGTHVVLPKRFLPGDFSLMIPKTEDGRVLFALPWHNRILAGTTDVSVREPQLEPQPTPEEIDFILGHLRRYLTEEPTEEDILTAFSGLRPLVQTTQKKSTAALGRDHSVLVSNSGLVSVLGGKWTTYRKMAEDAVNRAAEIGNLPKVQSCSTGIALESPKLGDLRWPGEAAVASREFMDEQQTDLRQPLEGSFPYCRADIIRAAREEWACTLEDVLARRTRFLFLDARASMKVAPFVASIMATELGQTADWENLQVQQFRELARRYLPV